MSVFGDRTPRLRTVPPYERTAGPEVVELAARAGLVLDPWQADCLMDFCAETADGRWSTFENAVIVSRQNGKGGIFEARVLAGLFLFDEELILYSAHRFATAREMFLRIKGLVDNTDDFRRRIKRVTTANGEEGIETLDGQRLRFLARSSNSGRGFSGHVNILDEAFNLGGDAISALLPTMSAIPNPQMFYGSSAGWEISEHLGSVRNRALKAIQAGEPDPSLAFREWSAPDETKQTKEVMADHKLWAMANPALGYRISLEFTAKELRSMTPADFARERLGIGSWPADVDGWRVIPQAVWESLYGGEPEAVMPVAIAVDMTPDRSHTSIGLAFKRDDELMQLEVADHRPGSAWALPRVLELTKKYGVCAIVISPAGEAASLIPEFEAAELEIIKPSGREEAQAFGLVYDGACPSEDDPKSTVRHRSDPELTTALAGAQKRSLGGASAWARQDPAVVISPLVAVTLAAWGHATHAHEWASDYDVADSLG